jgi:hypothetical protein
MHPSTILFHYFNENVVSNRGDEIDLSTNHASTILYSKLESVCISNTSTAVVGKAAV